MRASYTHSGLRLLGPAILAAALSGCAAVSPPLILVPAPTPRAVTYYQHGQPVAAADADSASVMLAADDCILYGTPYLRVWLLYFNRTQQPVLLDPVHSVVARASYVPPAKPLRPLPRSSRLDVSDSGGGASRGAAPRVHVGSPELPYKLLGEAENARSRAAIAEWFGGVLESAAAAVDAHPTTITTSDGRAATLNDRDEKLQARSEAIAQRTGRRIDDINSAHELFAASFNSGALRKHTVFPQSGVNGYLYIPLDPYSGRPGTSRRDRWLPEGITYTVRFALPGLADSVTFTPGTGE